ncbi:Cu(I)-responsive transcriptional regulator [Lichenihabitans psoromatis]|uniref:Cu(I)-responsive transcriptional regulator n=1 Tax=Lichenihabitans psoromatis TaxID=2528642 RepID=UPI001036190A|nr:Cu(I)-responsive transcriptional regulator [Lichenihabitans psoromatis]
MQIGQAAKASGVTAKMIRHYEVIDLIPSATRQDSNYRSYSTTDVHRLKFIRRARDLGFPLNRIRELLTLWSDRNRCSSEVKAIAQAHIAELETKIEHMRDMAGALHGLADACEGDDRPECPIMDGLGGSSFQARLRNY